MTTASKPARQLGELLLEQQEPFILEVYLSERGRVRKNLISGANFIPCHGSSGMFPKTSGCQRRSKKAIPHFLKALKFVLCNRFFRIKGLRTRNSDDEDGKPSVTEMEMEQNNQETAEPDRFSSSCSSTVFNSCSDSDIDEPSMFPHNSKSTKPYAEKEKKAAVDTKLPWGTCMEESKQHSPQSVLEEISTSTGSPLDTARRIPNTRQKSFLLPKLITEDSIFSASLWNLLLQTNTPAEKSSCGRSLTQLQQSNSSPFLISKRVLRQTKQLVLDCVRELVDDHGHGNNKKNKGKEFLGSEEIGNVICEKIRGWGKRCGDESNIKEMLELDIMDSRQEWNDFESQKKDTGLLIGNAIVEEIISEVVMDMIQCPLI